MKYDDGREPSTRHLRVQKGIRMFASAFLQEHLLTLPALPTREKLRAIRETREREAEERMKELQRQKEEQRQRELQRAREEEEAASASRRENPLSKLSIEFSLPKMKLTLKGEESIPSPTGWVVESAIRRRLDSSDDPFVVQQQQLLEYREQAMLAGRTDEVAAIEESLRDIEAEIQKRES